MNKKVFVVIVTYNGAVWIDRNIASLLHSAYPVHIIAIDNNSQDNSLALLKNYPEVEVVALQDNLGFGKANNIGIKMALEQGADYVLLFNQDAWVFTDTISSLVQKMQAENQLGVLSPMHYNADEITRDANFAVYYSRKLKALDNLNIAIVPFVNAAAWMVSKKCFETVGLFEPEFSHYGEDRNFCDRVTYHKFFIGIDEDSKIVHDRTIVRNFKKDIIQSKYKLLTTLLNINHTFLKSYLVALKEVFGLPKYFARHYGAGKGVELFFKLAGYYFTMVFSVGKIIAIRNKSK